MRLIDDASYSHSLSSGPQLSRGVIKPLLLSSQKTPGRAWIQGALGDLVRLRRIFSIIQGGADLGVCPKGEHPDSPLLFEKIR